MRVSLLVSALLALPAVALAASWTASPFTQTIIMGVSMSSSTTGYIAGGTGNGVANALLTNDGGQTFTSIPVHQPAIMFLGVAARSATSAVIGGLGTGFPATQYTADGKAFTNSSMGKVSLQQTQDAALIADDDMGFALTGSFSFWGSNETINGVSYSADGGKTFKFVDIGNDAGARYGAFPSSSVGFISSGSWPSSKKVEQGVTQLSRKVHMKTTHKKQLGRKSKKASTSLHFNLNTEDAVEDGGWSAAISLSTNGFDSWSTIYTNNTFYFNQISCPSEKVCFAAAENDDVGLGYATFDGGMTWTELLVAEGVSMMAAQAISETEAYFGGGILQQAGINGTLYHTTDAGKTFTTTVLPGYYLTALDFTDANHGFATAMNAESTCNFLIYA